jgi:hypothetical protein
MPVIALLILAGFWVLGAVVAMAVCRAAAEGDRADAGADCTPAITRPVPPLRRPRDVQTVT